MSRKRVGLSLSLFPFLAVLICTMGVLVALLLLVVKQAEDTSSQEEAAAIAQANEESSELELRTAEVQLRNQLLEAQRDDRRREMINQRELLGHLESEMAAVRTKAEQLAEQIRAVQATTQATADPVTTAQVMAEQQRQLEQLREKLDAAKLAQVEKAATKRQAAKPMYSIVPLAAQSGTNRRPIYVECLDDGMYLYPGGIKLSLDDFVLPLTPGNPLDTALLAYREYWRKTEPSAKEQDQAYPLLVVRPSGAKWYSVARRAMSGWDQEFGYELIPEDWQVNFGTADPELVRHVEQAIDAARNRQLALVSYGQAIPATQAGSVQPTAGVSNTNNALIPATGGGFSPAPSQPNRQRNTALQANNPSFGNGPDPVASFSSQFQSERNSGATTSSANRSNGSGGEETSILSSSRQTPPSPNFGLATSRLPNQNINQSRRTGSTNPSDAFGQTTQNFNSSSANSSSTNSSSTNGQRPNATGNSMNAQAAQPSAPSGTAGLPSTGMPMMAQGTQATSETQSQNTPSPDSLKPVWNRDSMAHERGADWALPSRRNAVSAYYRPVIVNVQADALVLPPGEGSPRSQTIPTGNSLAESVDPLANAIWQRVDKWGYLGFDGYWKPVLELRFTAENEDKARALQRLLEGSGLDVKLPESRSGEAAR